MGEEKRVRVQCPECGMQGHAMRDAVENPVKCPKCGKTVRFEWLMTEDEMFFEGAKKTGSFAAGLLKRVGKFGARQMSDHRERSLAKKRLRSRLKQHFEQESVSKDFIEGVRNTFESLGLGLSREAARLRVPFEQFMKREGKRLVALGRSGSLTKAAFEEHLTTIRQYLGTFGATSELASAVERDLQLVAVESDNATPLEHFSGLAARSAEVVWYQTPALLVMRTSRGEAATHQGYLFVTNLRVVFPSRSASDETPLSAINAVESDGDKLYLLGKGKSASSEFIVGDPELADAYVRHALRLHHRQVDVGFEGPARQVPQEVKQAVWQRDGGCCVQCGATDYLEFDHIIPYAKGGASTVDNVQLLCRRCNLKKSDRL